MEKKSTPPVKKNEFKKIIILLGSSLVIGLIAVFSLRLETIKDQIWPWLLLIYAMVIGGLNLIRIESVLFHNVMKIRISPDAIIKWKKIGILLVGSSLFVTILIIYKLMPDINNWRGTVSLWIISMLAILLGAWLIKGVGFASPRIVSIWGYWTENHNFQKFEVIAFILIFVVAIILRIYNFYEIPPGIYVDETNAALDALYIIEGRQVSPFGTGWYGTPNGYIYYMAGIIKLFGANWLSLKIISLIPAILTIPAVFILTRLIFGSIPGLIAMLLMASSRWHLSMSRWGWNETAPPLFQVLAIFFLIRGLRDRRALDFAIGGIISGLMTYTYLSSRLALFTIFLFIIYWFITDPNGWKESLRRSWVGIFIFFLSIFIAIGPTLATYISDPFSFNNRVNEISILRDMNNQNSIRPLTDNILDILIFFHHTGDLQGKHNLPGEPMVDLFTGLFFAVGFIYAMIKLRDYRCFLLTTWLLIGLAGSFLSSNHESPQSYRSLTALPAVIILAATTLDMYARSLNLAIKKRIRSKNLPFVLKNLAIIFIVIILSGASYWDVNTYFTKQAKSIDVISGFNPIENGIAHEVINAYRENKSIYLSPRFSEYSPLRFLVYEEVKKKTGQNSLDERPYKVILPEVNLPVPYSNQDVILLLDYDYYPMHNYFLSIYPKAKINLVNIPNNAPLYLKVEIPGEHVAELQGVLQRTTDPSGTISEQKVDLIKWDSETDSTEEIEWEGLLRLEYGTDIDLLPNSNVKIFIDDIPWTGTKYLGRGIYNLKVIKPKENIQSFQLAWKIGDNEIENIPANVIFSIPTKRNGLLSSYYRNLNWEGSPVFQQITPFLLLAWPDQYPINDESEFSIRFTGSLEVEEAGEYLFKVEADDGARLLIDGVELGAGLEPNQPNDFEVKTELTKGRHEIQIDYFQQGGGSALRLFWQFGDNPLTPIPPEVLFPN
ncbi:MAG: PA14 domain-containing protein [Anaerolineaceae bacterium]|nr:PA14 domain-containing protein [Anaerolineaceae bacterium]